MDSQPVDGQPSKDNPHTENFGRPFRQTIRKQQALDSQLRQTSRKHQTSDRQLRQASRKQQTLDFLGGMGKPTRQEVLAAISIDNMCCGRNSARIFLPKSIPSVARARPQDKKRFRRSRFPKHAPPDEPPTYHFIENRLSRRHGHGLIRSADQTIIRSDDRIRRSAARTLRRSCVHTSKRPYDQMMV